MKLNKILSIGFLLLEALILLIVLLSQLDYSIFQTDIPAKIMLWIIFITLNILSIIGLIKD